MRYLIFMMLVVIAIGCSINKPENKEEAAPTQVTVITTLGEITLELSDKTPKHRDNFITLVEEGVFDSLLFHRVIEGFVIQGGDPDSKMATATDTLGNGGREYKVPAEFDSTLFHKRGALGAARNGNPDRASSAMQFYVVQASTPIADSVFDIAEGRINGWLKNHYHINASENKMWYDSMKNVMEAENWEAYTQLNDTLKILAENFEDFDQYSIPEAHIEIYRSMGGVPHLDQNYTVFGEVIAGMSVVDSIAALATNDLDRPLEDIRIISARIKE